MKEIQEKLITLIKGIVHVDTIPMENLYDSLEIDSLVALEILVAIEQEFNIEINDEDLNVDLLSSIDTLTQYIVNKEASHPTL